MEQSESARWNAWSASPRSYPFEEGRGLIDLESLEQAPHLLIDPLYEAALALLKTKNVDLAEGRQIFAKSPRVLTWNDLTRRRSLFRSAMGMYELLTARGGGR
jgi:hypothetical protein